MLATSLIFVIVHGCCRGGGGCYIFSFNLLSISGQLCRTSVPSCRAVRETA